MVLQVKIPNIYYIDDHHPDSETEWMKCKIKYGGERYWLKITRFHIS